MLIAGDIGGTNTRLALVSPDAGPRRFLAEKTYPSGDFPGLSPIVRQFLQESGASASAACFDVAGPDFGFRRCFAACVKDTLPEKDRLWAVDQVMEIESPEAIKTLQKTLSGLFHPESVKSRRPGHGVSGE